MVFAGAAGAAGGEGKSVEMTMVGWTSVEGRGEAKTGSKGAAVI